MSIVISNRALGSIQKHPTHAYFHELLLSQDYKRFRGLGVENTNVFINHAIEFCETNKFRGIDEYAYVMFLMMVLGSYFTEDVRYMSIAAPLSEASQNNDTRIDRARSAFIEFADVFIGKKYEKYCASLRQFCKQTKTRNPNEITAEDALKDIALSFNSVSGMSDHLQRWFHNIHQREKTAEEGKIAQSDGYLFTALSFWLGTGFYKDPLFPWVRDKMIADGSSAHSRQELSAYAQKRLKKQLMYLEAGNENA